MLDRGQGLSQLLDHRSAVEVLATVAVAVHGQQHLRFDLREPVDDAAHAEVGRAGGPDRAEGGHRVEGGDGLRQVGQVGRDAVALSHAQSAQPRGDGGGVLAQFAPGPLGERTQLGGVPDRDGVVVTPLEDVPGVVERRAGEPFGARHAPVGQDRLVGGVGPDPVELPDGRPETVDVGDRPAPQGVVVEVADGGGPAGAEGLDPLLPCGPSCERDDVGGLDPFLVGLPEHTGHAALRHWPAFPIA